MAVSVKDLKLAKNKLQDAVDKLNTVVSLLDVETIDSTGNGIETVQTSVNKQKDNIETEKTSIDTIIGLAGDGCFDIN